MVVMPQISTRIEILDSVPDPVVILRNLEVDFISTLQACYI
jgi:hypothetical protein